MSKSEHYIPVIEFVRSVNEELIEWGIPEKYLLLEEEAVTYLDNNLSVHDAVRDAANAFHFRIEKEYPIENLP